MRRFKCGLVLLVFGFALSTAARVEAAPITGGIGFSGAVVGPINWATVNSMDIESNVATVLCSLANPCSGDFAAFNAAGPYGNGAVYNDFTFGPLPGVAISPLWTFDGYGFNLSSVTEIVRSSHGVQLFGTGILFRTGNVDPTLSEWSFSANQTGTGSNAEFRFAATNSAIQVVPDAGSSMILLGSGLLALTLVRRRFQA